MAPLFIAQGFNDPRVNHAEAERAVLAVQALQDAWLGHWPHPLQLITMAAYLVVFGVAAAKLFRWK